MLGLHGSGASWRGLGSVGSGLQHRGDRHPDELAEAVRAAVCDDELVQIIGRVRGVNRSAADPVEVVVFGNIPLPVEVDAFEAWTPPGLDDRMLAQGAWLESAGDAARAYGLGRKALDKARERMATISYKRFPYENVANLQTARYRRAGPGFTEQRLVFDPRLVPEPRAWLEDRLGKLAAFEVDQVPASQPVTVETPSWALCGGKLPPELQPVIRSEIAAIGLSQRALAERIGINQPHLANYLRGHDPLAPDKAERLQAVLAETPRRQLRLV